MDAWIEIKMLWFITVQLNVASYMDAWVEIIRTRWKLALQSSRPIWLWWLRGLKLWYLYRLQYRLLSHSTECVDWNTQVQHNMAVMNSRILHGCEDWNETEKAEAAKKELSHPTWIRGLKYDNISIHFNLLLSHPIWMRGLSFFLNLCLSYKDIKQKGS